MGSCEANLKIFLINTCNYGENNIKSCNDRFYTHERKIFPFFVRESVPTAATKWLATLCGRAHHIILSGHVFRPLV